MCKTSRRWIAVIALVSAAISFQSTDAMACGGCFSPPGPNLVVQDAERILFYRDPVTNKTKVWVEVRYSGPAEDFGWVLPLPKKPKVGVGTSYVFDRLDQAVAPRFFTKFSSATENCHSSNAENSGFGCGGFASDEAGARNVSSPSSGFGGAGQDGDGKKVTVLEKAQAGPFDYEIVSSTDSAALLKWLNDNGYATPDKALPVIKSHLSKGDLFVAFKLTNGAGVNEIRPVTLEMDGADACVPLRLTAIAASDNMAVVVYLLGAGRGVPKNHMHVAVNETKLRWAGGVNNYTQALAAAIDEAAGRAFVTEFAGPAKDVKVSLPDFGFRVDSTALFSNAIPNPNANQFTGQPAQAGIADSVWKAGKLFEGKFLNPDAFKAAKTQADVAFAVQSSKFAVFPETAAILEKHTALAALSGNANLVEFWSGVRSGQIKIDKLKANKPVDGGKLFDEMKVGIIEPIYIIDDAMGAKNITLTRLHMRISPDEMDRDPIFAFHPKLPNVSNSHTAELMAVCTRGDFNTDAMRLTLKSGSWIFQNTSVDFQANQAAQVSTSMSTNLTEEARFKDAPFASRIEVLEESGDPVVIPTAQIGLVDTAIAGAEVGTPSLPKTLVLSGASSLWTPPKSDPDAGLSTAAEQAHADDSGCTLGLGRRFSGMMVILLMCGLVLAMRRRRA
ncbi:MAG: DUF2330 domain-containing protein [Myxococcales bacterium]|nr:DUF2330 domain-containing protein [Myxococcales bacterium]